MMIPNAYILDWTMNAYETLKHELTLSGFDMIGEPGTPHSRVAVPLDRLEKFIAITQSHLNGSCNYIDVQYPDVGLTVILFVDHRFSIRTDDENARVKAWAIARGLPPDQADWATSY